MSTNCSSLFYDGHFYELKSSNASGSLLTAFSEYSGTPLGVFRIFKLICTSCDIGVRCARIFKLSEKRISDLNKISASASCVKDLMVVPSIISWSGKNFFTYFFKWRQSGYDLAAAGDYAYSVLDLSIDLVDFAYLFKLSRIASFVLGKVGSSFYFIRDLWDAKKYCNAYFLCEHIKQESSDDDVKIYVREKKRFLMMKAISTVIDFVLTAAIFVSFVGWGAILPISSGAKLLLETISFTISYGSDVYGQSMRFQLALKS